MHHENVNAISTRVVASRTAGHFRRKTRLDNVILTCVWHDCVVAMSTQAGSMISLYSLDIPSSHTLTPAIHIGRQLQERRATMTPSRGGAAYSAPSALSFGCCKVAGRWCVMLLFVLWRARGFVLAPGGRAVWAGHIYGRRATVRASILSLLLT